MRARDLLPLPGEPGEHNAITDVPGVRVGFVTIDEPAPRPGRRLPVLTGVTAVVPADAPVRLTAGFHRFNGNGEMTGTHWIADSGDLVGPVLVTNTHAVGRCHQAAIRWQVARFPDALDGERPPWLMPVVAETYDGPLSDINAFAVEEAHALAALDAATAGPVAEGNVGGGAGMVAYGWKAGTGTASRRLAIDGGAFTLGVLVQANHGLGRWFTVLGRPAAAPDAGPERGSIIVVVATDVPLAPDQLSRIARRGVLGIARGGTMGGNGSGDLILALSTAEPRPLRGGPAFERRTRLADAHLDALYEATVGAVEEAVLNAMLAATTVDRRPFGGPLVEAIGADRLVALWRGG